jgi:protein-L-isoaspartate(D-aspartate) O-methyltransferase
MIRSDDLVAQRKWYAEELRWSAMLNSKRLIDALSTVPREQFLGRGPWLIRGPMQFKRGYTQTSDSNPRHLCHDVLVAIDSKRNLNNGQPSFLAGLIQLLNLREGQTVYHVGCGTGYYTAIMAELVGSTGRVIGVEVDEELAQHATKNLHPYEQVEVVNADGFTYDPGRVDAILVNAGVNHMSLVWLNALRTKGRMVLPMTLANQNGGILKVVRTGRNWQARFTSGVGIFPCIGGRDGQEEEKLEKAFKGGGAYEVRSLRLDRHRRTRECWLHGKHTCLSKRSWNT